MKKKTVGMLVLSVIMIVCLFGCSGKEKEKTGDTQTEESRGLEKTENKAAGSAASESVASESATSGYVASGSAASELTVGELDPEMSGRFADFLENADIVKITVNIYNNGKWNTIATESPELISEYYAAFRSADFYYQGVDNGEISNAENCSSFVFTGSDGREYKYCFDDNDILSIDSKKYSLKNDEAVIEANNKIMGVADNYEEEEYPLVEYYKETAPEDVVTSSDGTSYVANQLLISADINTEYEDVAALQDEMGFDIVGYIEFTKDYQIEFREEKSYEELIDLEEYFSGFDFIRNCTLNYVMDIELQ